MDLTPTFTESYVPTEAGDGGWVDVPEQWDADYYEPEWEEEYLEPMEEQQDAAYYAAPYNTESGLSDEWDSTQQRLDDQLAQLASGASLSQATHTGSTRGISSETTFTASGRRLTMRSHQTSPTRGCLAMTSSASI